MTKIENQCAQIFLHDPAVPGWSASPARTGANASESTARMFIQLKPFAQRPAVQQVMARLRPQFNAGHRRQGLHAGRAGHQASAAGSSRRNINIRLTDTNIDRAEPLGADPARRACRRCKILTDAASDLQIASPQRRRSRSTAMPPIGSGSRCRRSTRRSDDAFGQTPGHDDLSPTYQSKVILEVEPQFLSQPTNLSDDLRAEQHRRRGAAVGGGARSPPRPSR